MGRDVCGWGGVKRGREGEVGRETGLDLGEFASSTCFLNISISVFRGPFTALQSMPSS